MVLQPVKCKNAVDIAIETIGILLRKVCMSAMPCPVWDSAVKKTLTLSIAEPMLQPLVPTVLHLWKSMRMPSNNL